MTTRDVQEAVKTCFGNYDHPIINSFIFDWESDFFAISKSGYSVEVEVKVSRQDFKKDFTHKTAKHELFKRRNELAFIRDKYETSEHAFAFNGEWIHPKCTMITWTKPCESIPNKFYYACPEGLISPDEVPAYAGLIYAGPIQYQSRIIKPAPFLHKNKKCFAKILLGKYYYRNNKLYQLLCSFKRMGNLTEKQECQLLNIINRMH